MELSADMETTSLMGALNLVDIIKNIGTDGSDRTLRRGSSPAGAAECSAATASIAGVLERRRVVFDDLLTHAEAYFRSERHLAAAVYAEIAANYAMSQHTGLFTSHRLEVILQRIGREAIADPRPGKSRKTARRLNHGSLGTLPHHVLHVLTRAQGVGGDTRMVWRWIRSDRERRHSVVLTRQGSHPVPSALQEAVSAAQGEVHVLNRQRGNLLTWAAALRGIASAADMAVLHVHPYDIIPSLALADKDARPPVIFADHADHAFWVGTEVADVIAGLRESGSRLAQARRGIPPARCAILPIVLPEMERTFSRDEAKRQLGVPRSAVLLLSIARPHKYRPVEDLDFLEGVLPVLDECQDALLWVIGPESGEPWTGAAERTGGRVRVFGERVDTALFYQAADVYVDAFPIVSITSLLEAGSYGLPLVSRCWPGAVDTVLCADTPGLARCLIQDCGSSYQELLRLVQDASYRAAVGEHTTAAIMGVHGEGNWQRLLEPVYRQASALLSADTQWQPASDDLSRSSEMDAWLMRLFDAEPDLQSIIQFHLQLLPLDLRLVHWLRFLRANPSSRSGPHLPSPGLLLPEWFSSAMTRKAAFAFRRSA